MNRKYGKLESDELTYAPDTLVVDGRIHTNPSETSYNAQGWLTIHDEPPTPADGYHVVPSGWEVRDGAIYRVYTQEQDAPIVRRWTPLSIKRACGDKWVTVKTALQNADLYEEFLMAQYLAEDDASFVQGYTWACEAFGKDAVDAILAAAETEA